MPRWLGGGPADRLRRALVVAEREAQGVDPEGMEGMYVRLALRALEARVAASVGVVR